MDSGSDENPFESPANDDYNSSTSPYNHDLHMPQQNQFINPTQFQFQPQYRYNFHTNLGPGYGFQSMMSDVVSSTQPQSFPPQLQSCVPPSQAIDINDGKQSKKKRKNNSPTIQAANVPRRPWTTDEDIALVKSYLYVSVDSIVGKDQSSGTMWSRILKAWKENMGTYNDDRNANALSCRWGTIQGAVNKFQGVYELLERNPSSGTSISDVKAQALKMYKTQEKTTFKYEHCWEIMKQNAKWCTQQLTKPGSSKKEKPADVIVLETNRQPPSTERKQENKEDGVQRPEEGRKLSKENAKKALDQKGVIGFLSSFQSTLEKQNAFNQQELELKKEKDLKEFELMQEDLALKRKAYQSKEEARKKKAMLEERRDDERILSIEVETLNPALREAYEILQARILKKWKEDATLGNESESRTVIP